MNKKAKSHEQKVKMSSLFTKESPKYGNKYVSRLIFHQESRNLTLKKSYSFDK